MACTITRNLKIVPGTRADYKSLSHFHYRESHLGPCAAIYVLKAPALLLWVTPQVKSVDLSETVGVIVYSMPTAGAQMRNIATGGIFEGLDKGTQLRLINKNIRTISRVIIEPRFRSLGLAVRLVKETMSLMNVPFIEAFAVMGRANPFFEKAGLNRYDAPVSTSCVRLTEAFSTVGIDEHDLIDPALVQKKLECQRTADNVQMFPERCTLNAERCSDFIESEITRFLQSYGRRRFMPPGIDRTKFILSKLTDPPVYYLWRNQNIELRT